MLYLVIFSLPEIYIFSRDISFRSSSRDPSLIVILWNGPTALDKWVLAEYGIDPGSVDHDAAEGGHETVVKLLLRKDTVNPNFLAQWF